MRTTKYARFFSIAGRMEWDGIHDDDELQKRIVMKMMTEEERAQFEREKKALANPGGFIKFPFMVLVRLNGGDL